jgi:hypothetical protein
VLAPVLAFTACASEPEDAPPARRGTASAIESPTTVKTAPPSTTTTVAQPYSFEPAPTPPPLLNTGTDYVAIARSLLEYSNWLLAHRPDDRLIDNIAAEGSSAHDSLKHDFPILRRTGRRMFETTNGPDEITVVSVTDNVVSLRDRQFLLQQTIVDASGTVQDVKERATVPTTYLVLLRRQKDRWLLASVDEQENSGEVGL